jgi:hypothetical protein
MGFEWGVLVRKGFSNTLDVHKKKQFMDQLSKYQLFFEDCVSYYLM